MQLGRWRVRNGPVHLLKAANQLYLAESRTWKTQVPSHSLPQHLSLSATVLLKCTVSPCHDVILVTLYQLLRRNFDLFKWFVLMAPWEVRRRDQVFTRGLRQSRAIVALKNSLLRELLPLVVDHFARHLKHLTLVDGMGCIHVYGNVVLDDGTVLSTFVERTHVAGDPFAP